MTDRHLFYLDADWEWDLAYDQCQWMIRRLIRRQNAIFPRGPLRGAEHRFHPAAQRVGPISRRHI